MPLCAVLTFAQSILYNLRTRIIYIVYTCTNNYIEMFLGFFFISSNMYYGVLTV